MVNEMRRHSNLNLPYLGFVAVDSENNVIVTKPTLERVMRSLMLSGKNLKDVSIMSISDFKRRKFA